MLLVPKIKKNLLSISRVTKDNNLIVEFCDDICVFKDKSTMRILLKRTLKDGLYSLHLSTNPSTFHALSIASQPSPATKLSPSHSHKSSSKYANSSQACPFISVVNFSHVKKNATFNVALAAKTNSSLWHAKLGHPSRLVLSKVLNSMNFNVNVSALPFCDSCKLGKLHKLPFTTHSISANQPL
ncbi:hypothetical protein ACOSQ2_005576 [Xanthoceras sorbifolium]